MSTTKHTPGPWSIHLQAGGETSGLILANDGITFVCDTGDAAFHNAIARGQIEPATAFLAQCKANAQLISAAPELLEALKEQVADIEARMAASPMEPRFSTPGFLVRLARSRSAI